MTVWIKELAGILTSDKVSVWIKKDIELQPFSKIDDIQIDDFIVISKQDSVTESDFVPFTTIIYEDFFETITYNVIQEHQYNYDYYHLKNALLQARTPSVDTIITGSSYGLFGIDTDRLVHEVNLSLSSQDLFYSLKGIYETCRTNKNIKNIVLCCGYYYFFSDLSKTQNQDEILRISKVYQPLYNDIHNCTLLPPKSNILFQSDFFNVQNIADLYSMGEYKKHYFHADRLRKIYATKEWDDKSKSWVQLTEKEKEYAAQKRTSLHNKNYKRELSLIENSILFKELVSLCNREKINLLVVVTPASKYYRDTLYSGYKDIFYDVLNNVDGVIHLLDLFEDAYYLEEDFNDTDHLSDLGAKKMTDTILDMLQKINME